MDVPAHVFISLAQDRAQVAEAVIVKKELVAAQKAAFLILPKDTELAAIQKSPPEVFKPPI